MRPEETVWEIEPHTEAKHTILRKYLEAWLPIMSKYNDRLVYVDGFAGPGVYAGGEPGSPIIALTTAANHDHKHLLATEVVYAFIEEDADRAARLEKEITKLGKLEDNLKPHVIHGSFQDEFGAILDDIENKGTKLAPTFAFIDPFGYSKTPMRLSGRFLQFDRCEVLIYVPLPWINRFVGKKDQKNALNSLFGSNEWEQAIPLSGKARLRALHDLFEKQLHEECGLTYVRSFEIVTAKPSTGYTLFFGTKHKLGLLRMKEAMWRVDPLAGQTFRDTTNMGMQPLFELEVDTAPLRDALMDHFGSKQFAIEDAEDFTLVDTPYIPSHLKTRTLKPVEKADRLQVLTARKKRWTYPAGTRMRFIP